LSFDANRLLTGFPQGHKKGPPVGGGLVGWVLFVVLLVFREAVFNCLAKPF